MKTRKIWAFILSMVITMQLVVTGGELNIYAEGGSDVTSIVQLIPEPELQISNGGTILLPDSNGNYSDVPTDASIKIRYDFSLPDDDGQDPPVEYSYAAGDYFQVQLPTVAAFSTPAGGEIKIEDGTVLANLTINTDGLATITFTDYVESHSGIYGHFEIEGSFKEELLNQPDPISITLLFNGTIITIGIKEAPSVNVDITKSGVYDAATNLLTWTVVTTPAGEANSVYVIDTFGPNQAYVANSFSVNGALISSGLTLNEASRTLTYLFPASISTAQTITYQTTPTATAFDAETGSSESVAFLNNAIVKIGSITKDEANATVSVNWVQKNGWVDATDIKKIHWEIKVNNSGKTITGAVIEDTIPAGLELIAGTVKLGGIPVLESASGELGYYQYDATERTLTYRFDSAISTSKTLTYDTAVTDLSAYNSNTPKTFTNRAEFTWDGNISGIPWDNKGVSVGVGILSKAGTALTNYNNTTTQEITWTIIVNKNKIDITNASIVDSIPAGLEYVENSFAINDMIGDPATYAGIFSYSPVTGSPTETGIISYGFGATRTISNTYTITYKTKITDYTALYINGTVTLNNAVTLTGDGIKDGTQSITGRQQYNSQIISKSVQGSYNYNTRIIQWTIAVNRNQIPMNNAVVIETLPAGLEFLENTFSITPTPGGVAGGVLNFEKTAPDDIVGFDTFTYTFPTDSAISQMYTISFDTKVKEAFLLTKGEKTFINRVTLDADEFSPVTVSATSRINNPIIEKSATYESGADYIGWTVPINSNKVLLQDVMITDILQSGLELDVDSIKLYQMELNSSTGILTKPEGSVPISSDLYSVSYDANTNRFDFGLPGPSNEAYQLEFITDVLVDNITIDNSISFAGYGITATAASTRLAVVVNALGTGGGGSTGQIVLHKFDQDGVTPLSGAKFELRNNKGVLVQTKVTGADGLITFSGLLFKTYFVQEIEAPDGYLVNESINKIRITSASTNYEYSVLNQKALGDITFNKQTEEEEPLGGATFTLYNTTGAAIATAMSTSDGVVTFENVPLGNYTIKETQAPSGFYPSEVTINATVGLNQQDNEVFVTTDPTTVTNTAKTNQIFGSIIIHKTDENQAALAGATFKLYDSNGKVVQSALTGKNGKAIFNYVAAGNYVVKETTAPEGYQLSTQTISVKVNSTDAQTFNFKNEKLPVTPAAIMGSIIISKIDENSDPLGGATFTLYDHQGIAVASQKSGNDGVVEFEDVLIGHYTLKETSAPTGYRLVAAGINVTVKDESILNYRFRNLPLGTLVTDVPEGWINVDDTPIPTGNGEDPQLPRTGGFPGEVFYLLGSVFILLGLTLRKKCKC